MGDDGKWRYNARLECKNCAKETRHTYDSASGGWVCCVCQERSNYGDALSDMFKTEKRIKP